MRLAMLLAHCLRVRLLAPVVLVAFCLLPLASAHAADDATTQFRQTSASEHYANALSLIDARAFSEALALLRRLQAHYPGFEKLSSVQTRIAVLQEADDASNVLGHFLRALDQRDENDAQAALDTLEFVLQQYPESTLHDDALYLKAYIQLMDRYDFESARATLAELYRVHDGSSYQDSAEYLDAIALEQLGFTEKAQTALQALREKHTAMSLPFGFKWPAGNVLSRYWFDRADKRLAIIEQRRSTASQMRSTQSSQSAKPGSLAITVNVNGADLAFELLPSPLTGQTGWHDGVLQNSQPPAAGVYVGTVVGDENSWVRAVIVDDTISGVVRAFGQSYTMQPGTLIGTLDYYQPKSARTRSAQRPDSVSTEVDMVLDAISVPDTAIPGFARRVASKTSDLRVVPVSIVVDAEFDRYHGGNGLVTALNQLNVADGIYRQFGIALAVDEVQVFEDEQPDPLPTGPTTLEEYLKSFRNYRIEQSTFFSDSALTYLFTGKQRTDRTLGLAWIDTLCRTDGYDVGVTTPSSIGDVLLTHEIGHSLGSRHDTDTDCNLDSTKLMWPHISSNTQTEFSDCSQNSLANARQKQCLIDAVDLSLQLAATGTGVRFDLSNLDSSVAVDASLSIEISSPGLVAWPAGCQMLSPTSVQCAISNMRAGERRELYMDVEDPELNNDAIVTGQLMPNGTRDFLPSNNIASFSIGKQSSSSEHLAITSNPQGGVDTPAAATGSGSLSILGLMLLLLIKYRSFCQRSKKLVRLAVSEYGQRHARTW